MEDIAERIYEWSETHDKAIKIGCAILFAIGLILTGVIENGNL